MYNEQLNQLIAATLADGRLTDKEIEVLCRRAEAMGVDREEFAIYLEGKLVERQLQLQAMPGATQVLGATTSPPTPPAVPTPRPGYTESLFLPKPATPIAPASAEQHEEIGKCPACKETISGLTHVCPSCGLVIDADHDTHGSLEEMLEAQEQLLLQAKALARRSATESDLGLDYLGVPFVLICIGALCIGNSTSDGWLAVGLICWLSAFILYRKLRKESREGDVGKLWPELQEKFEKNDRQTALFFSDDYKVEQVLHTLRQQMATAVATIQAKRTKSFGYALVRLAVLLPFILAMSARDHKQPDSSETADSSKTTDFPDERPVLIKRLLNEQHIPEARALLAQLPDTSAARPALLEALYESSQNHRLDSLRSLLPERQYAVVRRGLINLWWNTAATTDTAARPAFEERKRRLNAELPAKYRLEEGWLTATGSSEKAN